jgi:tRNA dimethylallyltransferase
MPSDQKRIVRALEVYRLSGRPLHELYLSNDRLELDWHIVALNPVRDELYRRIETRVDSMLRNGLIEETRGIIERFGAEAYALQSIGYRHVLKYLAGEWSLEQTAVEMKKDTRHYAKRQMTWFRKNEKVNWFDPDTDRDAILRSIVDFANAT